jgi:hypothetical protein
MKDYTKAEYEAALVWAGFRRCDFPGHVEFTMSNGEVAHFCEAAAKDMFDTRREVLADLKASVEWEEKNIIEKRLSFIVG